MHAAAVKILSAVILLLLWGLVVQVIATSYYHSRAEGLIKEENRLTELRAQDMANSFSRNLSFMDGVPGFFRHAVRVNHALSIFGPDVSPSHLPQAERKRRWTANPVLKDLDQTLEIASRNFHVDLIAVINAAGDIVAASNWNMLNSAVGANVGSRHYLSPHNGVFPLEQYAVGEVTHIAGLYFSTPVIAHGRVIGAVMAKANVPGLSFLVRQTKSFVADQNGVIILSNDPGKEMFALPDSPVIRMPVARRLEIYRRKDFPELHIEPWSKPDFPGVERIGQEDVPQLLVSKTLPGYGLTVYVQGTIPGLLKLDDEKSVFFALLFGLGSMLILSAFGGLLYFRSSGRSKENLRKSEEKWRVLFENMTTGFALHEVICNDEGKVVDYRFLEINPAFERLTGLQASRMIGHTVLEMLPGTEQYWIDIFGKVAMTGESINYENYSKELGRWYQTRAFCPKPGQFAVIITDVTEQRNLENDLRIAATAFESQEGMYITDANADILRVNSAFTEITGYTPAEVFGRNPRMFGSERQDEDFYTDMWQKIDKDGFWEGEIWNRRKNGEIYPERLSITAVTDLAGKVTNYVASMADITSYKNNEEEIQRLAYYDQLTSLPNRRMLIDRLMRALLFSNRSQRYGALFFIDLDDFKTLNDTLGHARGDILLREVALRLSDCVREEDTVARLGGDEFVVMLEGLSENRVEASEQAREIGQKILEKVSQSYLFDSNKYLCTSSIGITLFQGQDQGVEELLKQADIAMYQAKHAGRNTMRFFDRAMQDTINTRVLLEAELRKAIESVQFLLYYQVQKNHLGGVLGAEALIRWIRPGDGVILPGQFIPVAEDTGLILQIGQWVIEQACTQLEAWAQHKATSKLTLSVNVSARQFYQPDFVSQVRQAMERHGVKPGLLKLELTESLLVGNIEDVIHNMSALSEIGTQISLDDFGTGYSSLQYLKRLPLNQLKIDQSFVRDISVDSNDLAIVRTIIAMAHTLGLDVIAEGVETEEQFQLLLREGGCTSYQGYLYGKPEPIEDFEAALKHA